MFKNRESREMMSKLAIMGAIAAFGVFSPGCSATQKLRENKAVQGVEKTAYNVETKAKTIEAKAHKSLHDHVDSIVTKFRRRVLVE